MSLASHLKKLSRRTITLRKTTDDGQPIAVTIRKVKAGEITARAGLPLRLLASVPEGPEDETPAERLARLREAAMADPAIFAEAVEFGRKKQAAVVCLGVVSMKVVDKPEIELADDEIRPEHFEEDLPLVYNAIVEFSGLPYNALEVRDLATFRPEQMGADSVFTG